MGESLQYRSSYIYLGAPDGSDGKASARNAGDLGSMSVPRQRELQLTPVFLPAEFHGQRSLEGYSSQGCKELDTTERLTLHYIYYIYISF